MLFCQFTKSQSVRDISNGLRSATGNLNHLGIEWAPSKSTISYQNKHRDWRLFRDYYYCLLKSLGQQASKIPNQIQDFTAGFNHDFPVLVAVRLGQVQNPKRVSALRTTYLLLISFGISLWEKTI